MNQDFYTRLIDLYQKYEAEIPLLEKGFWWHELQMNRPVLFVGHNPSKRKDDSKIDNFKEVLFDPIAENDRYFKHYYEIAKSMGLERDEWTYQDVFTYRETVQNAKKLYPTWIGFLCEHLQITQDIVEALKPKLIVVCNAKASEYFGSKADWNRNRGIWMGYGFEKGKATFKWPDLTQKRPEKTSPVLNETSFVFSSYIPRKSKEEREELKQELKQLWSQIK